MVVGFTSKPFLVKFIDNKLATYMAGEFLSKLIF
jgi:hypothetical protein